MGEAICKKYRETGVMPLDCLFGCEHNCAAKAQDGRTLRERSRTTCKQCGSETVHWLDKGDGFKLYENEKEHPGNRYPLHQCATSAEGFDDVD